MTAKKALAMMTYNAISALTENDYPIVARIWLKEL